MKLFPKKEVNLSRFLKENQVDFSNKEDIEKVVQFLASLQYSLILYSCIPALLLERTLAKEQEIKNPIPAK